MKKWKIGFLWKDAFFCTLFSFLSLGLFYFIIINLSFLDPFNKAFNDFSYTDIYYSKSFKPKKNAQIVIINVKQNKRFDIAKAINKVQSQKPKVVGLDIFFKNKKNKKYDSILKATLSNYSNIVTSYSYNEKDKKIEGNHNYFFTKNSIKGFVDFDKKKMVLSEIL